MFLWIFYTIVSNIIKNMQQQQVLINYKQHKSIFQSIKQEQRSDWISKMLQIPQKQGQYPVFKKDYPNHGKWMHDGYQLHYYYHINKVQPSKAILFYFPGLNSHGNGSAYFTLGLAQKCHIDIYSLDYKNFGRSAGQHRGYINSCNQLIKQAQDFVVHIMSQQKDKKPVYLSGLSMGGAITFKLANRHPQRYAGVIFLSPALRQNKEVTPFMKKIAKFMGLIIPRIGISSQTYTNGTKYNQKQIIEADQYIYKGKMMPGSIKSVLDLMAECENQYEKFTHPFIFIQSGIDKMVDPFQALDFEKTCKSTEKTVIYFKDMWHAIFGQDQLPDVIEAVNQWLQPRVNK